MKKSFILIAVLLFVLTACKKKSAAEPDSQSGPVAQVSAFEGAQGGGKYATGGRGGYVFAVTSLEDNDVGASEELKPGTLRYALMQNAKRTIVFQVAGVIHLKSPLEITKGNLTVLGQTAPGDGICIADYPVKIEKADNVILRFLRFRMGDEKLTVEQADGADALSVNNCKNVMIDHCSFSWSTDECVSCYGNENFTLQYSFITESLRKSKHSKDAHGYAGIWGGKNATFHHNLLAHHDSRNPRFDHDYVEAVCVGPIDYVNNVVYNWRSNSAYGGEGSTRGGGGRHINFVNNYYKPGPATPKATATLTAVGTRLVDPWSSCDNCTGGSSVLPKGGSVVAPKIYLTGNTMSSSDAVTADNWKGSTKTKSVAGVDERWTEGLTPVTNEQAAAEAFETVLAKAGCSLQRDAIDTRIADEVRNGTFTYTGSKSGTKGIIDRPSDVGGWPSYIGEPADSDKDGIPDQWESTHGLNPNDRTDALKTTLNAPYMNVEVYANELVKDLY